MELRSINWRAKKTILQQSLSQRCNMSKSFVLCFTTKHVQPTPKLLGPAMLGGEQEPAARAGRVRQCCSRSWKSVPTALSHCLDCAGTFFLFCGLWGSSSGSHIVGYNHLKSLGYGNRIRKSIPVGRKWNRELIMVDGITIIHTTFFPDSLHAYRGGAGRL